jgi:hypothetical protein
MKLYHVESDHLHDSIHLLDRLVLEHTDQQWLLILLLLSS